MSSQVVIVSLGPVQQFISQARRTQDLFMGSRLLSWLAQQGVEAAEAGGASLIYPVRTQGQLPESIPNRFVVIAEDGVAMGQQIEAAVRSEWQMISGQAFATVQKYTPDTAWDNIWQRQVDHWLEVYWVAAPYNEGAYRESLDRANQVMAARKLARYFRPGGEASWKCTICGEREVLHGPSRRYDDVRAYWADIQQRLGQPTLLREGERLCAICAIKRFTDAFEIASFPSTSSVAAASYKRELLAHWDRVEPQVDALYEALHALGMRPVYQSIPLLDKEYASVTYQAPEQARLLKIDGEYFFTSTYQEGAFPQTQPAAIKAARRALEGLYKITDKLGIARPHTYLAILALDGDGMGRLVGQCQSPDEHQRLSEALAHFAQTTVPDIVEYRYLGRLVYSGGDDVLALLPVRDALPAADELRTAFSEALAGAGFEGHASAGIAIVHHIQPLGSALQSARHAESAAKNDLRRNAVVVDVMKRSGEHDQVGAKWDYRYEGASYAIATTFDALRDAFSSGNLARGLPYDLQALAYAIGDIFPPEKRRVPAKACRAALGRLVSRRVKEGTANKQGVTEQQPILLYALGEALGWDQMALWAELARFIGRGGDS